VKHPEPKAPERLLGTSAGWWWGRALARSEGKDACSWSLCAEELGSVLKFLLGWHWHGARCGLFYGPKTYQLLTSPRTKFKEIPHRDRYRAAA